MKSSLLFGSLVVVALSGCAWLNQIGSSGTEEMLAAAGFQTRVADTPAKQAALGAMKPYQLTMRTRGGNVFYTYADPKSGIVYVGGPAQYSAYQKMNVQQQIAAENQMAAMEAESADWDWNMWGPWAW